MWSCRRVRNRSWAGGLLALALLTTGCNALSRGEAPNGNGDLLRPLSASHSLTSDGNRLAQDVTLADTAPRYHARASVDPSSGKITGTLWADLPVGQDADEARFRFFAGLPSFHAKPSLGPATVDGEQVDVARDHSIATVALPADHSGRVRVKLPFSYKLREPSDSGSPLSALGGDMSPADIGLLSRHEKAINLGHWLPLWVPEGQSHDAKPDGYGDIGNFPSALFSLEISVPARWQVVTGGFRTGEETNNGQLTVRSEGFGLRSLVVSLVRDYVSERREVGGTIVRVYGPRSAAEEITEVLDTAANSLRVLEEAFAPYPWQELDVVAAPLGAGVGGMEWSGAIWIDSGIFAGQFAGMSALSELGLGGDSGSGGIFGDMLGGLSEKMQDARAWTVAHEVGHQWWHILVGNDSVQAPVVDEPLAQYSACLVMRRTERGSTKELCDPHIAVGYAQMRMFGSTDASALQRSDEFTSSHQYSGVIYGKAPYFYFALEEKYGQAAVVAALGEVTAKQAFRVTTPEELRDGLGQALGDPDGVRELWRHWLRETHGDADMDTDLGLTGPAGDRLDGLLGDVLGESGGSDEGASKQEVQQQLRELEKLLDQLGGSTGGGQSGGQLGELFEQLQNS